MREASDEPKHKSTIVRHSYALLLFSLTCVTSLHNPEALTEIHVNLPDFIELRNNLRNLSGKTSNLQIHHQTEEFTFHKNVLSRK